MDQNLTAMAAVVGLVNGFKLFSTDKVSFAYFLLALVIGIGFGWLGFLGLTIETGLLVALASSGLYKVAQKLGGN